ncbi:hypothetical protein D3C87_1715490 [compost metagenome]
MMESSALSIADKDQCSRSGLKHVGEVFPGHRRLDATVDIELPGDGRSGIGCKRRLCRTVECYRISMAELDADPCFAGLLESRADIAHPLLNE